MNPSAAQPALAAQDGTASLLPHLRALRALQAVAAQGSTVAAAQAAHLSQPAITRGIHRLEQVCGQLLFVRTTRGMRPTEQGQQLAQRTERMLGLLQTGAREAMALDAGLRARPHAAQRFAHSVTSSQVRAFVAVAACGSEAQAAAQIGVSQPAVHAVLQELEHLLDIGLFYKLRSGTRLTPPGEALLLRVKQAVAELRGMDADMALWHGETRGRVVLGVLPLSAPIFLPRALQALMSLHPAVQATIIDGTYEDLMRHLMSADIDAVVGALRADVSAAEFLQHELFDDELVIVAHRDHPCFERQGLQLGDLLRWPWVLPLPHSPADRILRAVFAQHGLPAPGDRLCAGSPTITQSLVLQSGMLCITSRGQVLLGEHGGALRIVPVGLPRTGRRIGLTTRATTALSPDLRAFIDCCRKVARQAAA